MAWEWLCRYFGMSNGFIAVALVLVPVIVTGGIHVDGLLDTSDALSSWRDREKRLEILKILMQVRLRSLQHVYTF